MPTTCGFPNCKFRSRYRGQEDNRHFYRIPKRPPQLRQRWLHAIGRTEETVVSQLRICSAHFAGGEKKEGDIPVPDPQFDPPLFISLPPRGEALRYASAEQRQQRLLTKRIKLLNKCQYNSNQAINRRQNGRLNDEINAENPYTDKPEKYANNIKQTKSFSSGECSKFIDKLFDGAYPLMHRTPTSEDSTNNGNSSNISPCLFTESPSSQRLNETLSSNQPHNFAPLLHFLGMKGYPNLHAQHAPFRGITTSSPLNSIAVPTPMTTNTPSTRPLVALLDGRDCTIEMPLLKDIATVAFCDAQSTAEIHEKVLNEAVAAFLYHSISLSREDLLKFKVLKVVVRIGSGYHNVDVNAATELGIAICNTPVECVEETADTAMVMILNMFRKTFWLSRINHGNIRQPHNVEQLRELATGCTRIRGSTLGIIGLGRVGTAVAMRARAFGFHVIFYDPHIAAGMERSLDVERCEALTDLLKRADCISLHCPLNAETRFLLNADTIPTMKYGIFFVNTSAPDLIVSSVLLSALRSGHIRAAALEKYDRDSSFSDADVAVSEAIYQMPNVICTPHCAWYSDESSKELRASAAKEIRRALVGRFPDDLVNCVNKEALIARTTSAALNGLIPAGAANIQELANAAFGFHAAPSSANDAKVNLAAILSQNGGSTSSAPSGLYSSKGMNGMHGNGNTSLPKNSSAKATNPLLLSNLAVPGLVQAAGGDNTDMVEQLNSLMTQFGSAIPPEALSSLSGISSAAELNSGNNELMNYQNLMLTLNQQMFLDHSQQILRNAANSHASAGASSGFSAPISASATDVVAPLLAATSSAAVTTCGGGSGRSSVSQNSAAGSTFEQNRNNAGVKRKESDSPSVTPAKVSTSNRPVPNMLLSNYDQQIDNPLPKADADAKSDPNVSENSQNVEKSDVSKVKKESGEEYSQQQQQQNNEAADENKSAGQFTDVSPATDQ